MLKEEQFAIAKRQIFGQLPDDLEAKAGYNISVAYYDRLVEEAEAVALGWEKPHSSYPTYLQQAFTYSSHETFTIFPEKTRDVIEQCCQNFRRRYEPLLEELKFKAA